MKIDFKKLLELDLIRPQKLGPLMWPDKPAQNAGVLCRMKMKEIQGNKFTEEDFQLILSALKGNGEKKENKNIG
ncbi:MAG: hypothetical protein MUE81_22600 [Thermoflexibacter sp.]|jgi:hypothetical protein|nr:hypothetical protein [Thermoflexibacter sp.]